jgi:hypothetical protein
VASLTSEDEGARHRGEKHPSSFPRITSPEQDCRCYRGYEDGRGDVRQLLCGQRHHVLSQVGSRVQEVGYQIHYYHPVPYKAAFLILFLLPWLFYNSSTSTRRE